MRNSISINGIFLCFGQNMVELDNPVVASLTTYNKVFLVLSVPDGLINNNNVICFDINGVKLWTIEAKDYPNESCSITNITEKNGQIKVYRFCGIEEIVDMESGKIISSEFIK